MASTIASSQTIAFLLTVFWILVGLARVGADLLGPMLADVLFAIEPYGRLQDFTSGLIDTANIVYFVAGIVMFLMISTAIPNWGEDADDGRSAIIPTVLFMLGAVVSTVAISIIADGSDLRWRLMTKSRSYSLSKQTIDLLRIWKANGK